MPVDFASKEGFKDVGMRSLLILSFCSCFEELAKVRTKVLLLLLAVLIFILATEDPARIHCIAI